MLPRDVKTEPFGPAVTRLVLGFAILMAKLGSSSRWQDSAPAGRAIAI